MTVLAAVDVNQAPDRPITVGYDLSTAYDETLVVMYVMPQDEFEQRRDNREDLPAEFNERNTISQAEGSAIQKAAEAIDSALSEYDDERVEVRGSVGSPADEILAAIEEINPHYVVVGGRKRSPVAQLLFGSVSQAIVQHAEPPVVTLMAEAD